MGDASGDLRTEITSGDPARQSAALMAVLSMLAAGRDAAPHVSMACHALLGNATVAPAVRSVAYDLIQAATLTDADWGRAAVGICADLQKGSPVELRVKALGLLPALPGHRLAALLAEDSARGRIAGGLRHPSPEVRAAAIDAVAELITADTAPAAAAEDEELLGLLREGVIAACDGLTDDSDAAVAACCNALTALLRAAAGAHRGASAEHASEAKRAAGVRSGLTSAALERAASLFGLALARFRTLSTGTLPQVPPLLVAYLSALQPAADRRPLDALPGDPGAAGAARSHSFEESAALLAELVRRGDPAVVLAAAEGLFQLAEMDNASAAVQALLPSAIAAAVAAARAAGDRQQPVVQPAVLSLLLSHLDVLPAVQRLLLFHRLPPMIAAIPAAAERTRSFSQLWAATAAYDWSSAPAAAKGRRAAAPPPAPQLQQLLLDPAIKGVISGTSREAGGDAVLVAAQAAALPHPRFADPAFREELVGSLLYALLTHPRPAAATAQAPVAASSAIAQASHLQGLAEAVDWLASSKLALQGTKACLGWDRVAGLATTGSTAVVDLWLQLLLRSLQLCQGLRGRLAARGAEAAAAAAAAEAGKSEADPASAVLLGLYRRLGELEGELQGLLLQIVTNWRALHPVARCRAVWVCACHMRLKNVVDSAWSSLADALRGLLLEGAQGGREGGAFLAAVAEGALSARSLGDAPTGAKYEAAVAASAGEQVEVALLCLERLAGVVAYNNRGRLQGELGSVAGLLEKLTKLQADAKDNAPPVAERLARVLLTLGPVASSGKERRQKQAPQQRAAPLRASTENGAAGPDAAASAPVVLDLVPDPWGPATAAYPSTLPAAASLFATAEAQRYRKFVEQLQAAAFRGSSADTDSTAPAAAAARGPSGGLPTLLQLGSVLEGEEQVGGAAGAAGQEVTGPSTPVSLTLCHAVDLGAGAIRLRCTLANRTLERLAGVSVTLLPGGPIAGNRRPLAFRLDPLPPGGSTSWEVTLRCAGFGWPVVQPAVTLPVTVPAGTPSLRCKPYHVSPLQLLAPPARAVTPSEFYQRWQALPHRATLAAAPTERGPLGVQRVLVAVGAAGLTCVIKVVAPVAGGVHAAFHGAAWSGESIACIVTSSVAGSAGSGVAALQLHFGSESAEVMAHIRGHEEELLTQLTGGLAVPAAGAPTTAAVSSPAAAKLAEEPARPSTTFSFLRSVTQQAEAARVEGGGDEETDAAERAARRETDALGAAALAQWQRLRVMRAAG